MNNTQNSNTTGISPYSPPSNPVLDNETRVPEILGVLIPFATLTTIVVIMRIYTRTRILKILPTEDILIVIAQILTIGLVVIEGLEIKYGLGTHIWIQSPNNMVPSLKLFYTTVIIYFVALNTVKLSILFQIRRIFIEEKVQLVTLIGIVVIILWTFTGIFLAAFICIPVSSFWDFNIHGKCLKFETVYYTMAGINILTDFAIFSIPLPVIKSLTLPKREKIILFFIFSLGFFTCCVSIIRLRTLLIGATTQDPSWDEVAVTNWTFIELASAILTACLPTLRPLLIKVIPSILSSKLSSKNDTNGSQSQKGNQSKNKTSSLSGTCVEDIQNSRDGIISETKIQLQEV